MSGSRCRGSFPKITIPFNRGALTKLKLAALRNLSRLSLTIFETKRTRKEKEKERDREKTIIPTRENSLRPEELEKRQ